MTPSDFDRVFGRGRLRMVTGAHVEVFREEALLGERRRYTKRFLATQEGDFREWTEREWRILARLVGHGIPAVPDVVQFDRGAAGRVAKVQTYDAGITVDHWATLLPVERDGAVLRHVFEDCAHWWALARHCLIALDAIHELHVVHLDLKADNVCIPVAPADGDPRSPEARLCPRFEQLALIDFAFSLISGEPLVTALPIARQPEYQYQSPRLLQALEEGSRGNLVPTQRLDWRCDVFSLAAMLRRYLPDPEEMLGAGWTAPRHAEARALVRRLLEAHDGESTGPRPHGNWIDFASRVLANDDLAASLQRGWRLATNAAPTNEEFPTPVTRIARQLPQAPAVHDGGGVEPAGVALPVRAGRRVRGRAFAWGSALVAAVAIAVPALEDLWRMSGEDRSTPRSAAAPPLPVAQAARSAATAPSLASAAGASGAPDGTARAEASRGIGGERVEAAPAASPEAPRPALPPALAAGPRPRPPARASTLVASAPAARAVAPTPFAAPPAARGRSSAGVTPGSSRMTGRVTASAARGTRKFTWVAARPSTAAHRFAQVPNDGALLPLPAADELSPVRASLPPRIVAMLAATKSSPLGSGAPMAGTQPPAPTAAVATAPVPLDVRYSVPKEPMDFTARAGEVMTAHVPRIAQRAERLVKRVLFLAGHADEAWRIDEIRSAANGIGIGPQDPLLVLEWAAADARRLNEAARSAFRGHGSAAQALDLQTQAFGANPTDAEVAGNLAFLHLRQRPVNVTAARDLSLHALALHDGQHPGGRLEDWTTLAIASALAGRESEARDAWIVTLALAPNLERQCRAAVDAYAMYGERLRLPVETMLYRAHQWNPAERSAFCEWPPHWVSVDGAR